MSATAASTGDTVRMRFRQAIAVALHDEMAEDDSVIVLGEDIARAGGTFKATEGLLEAYGPSRVRDTPISEMGFVGAAVGAATQGMKPVVEIMFMEFLGVALDQLVTEAAKFRYLSAGTVTVPLTLRTSIGAGLGFGSQHSQTLENWVSATPGLKVVSPGDSASAYGLTRSAIRDPDPVVVLEPRSLYASLGQVTRGEAGIFPIGRARRVAEGGDVTLVGLGSTVRTCAQIATMVGSGVADVWDLATIYPWDTDSIIGSVRRTGRLVVVQEAPRGGGWAHEVVSEIVTACYGDLRAAPYVVSCPDVPVPYGKEMEIAYLPSAERIAPALTKYLDTGVPPLNWWEEGAGR